MFRLRATLVAMLGVACLQCGRSPLDPSLPQLKLSPTFLRFAGNVNEVVAPIQVSVVGATAEAYDFKTEIGAPWIVVTPDHGTTPAVVSVSVVTSGVAPGTHEGSLQFDMLSTTAGATGASLTVELELDAPGWTSLGGPYAATVTSLAADPDDADVVVAGTRRGAVLRSTDGGATFERVTSFLADDDPIWSVTLAAGGRGYLGTERDGVWRTDDHGASWQPSGLRNVLIENVRIDPASADRVLAEGSATYFSTDGGVSFATVTTAAPTFIAVDPTGVSTFVLGGDDGRVYRGDGSAFVDLTGAQTWSVSDFAVTSTGRWLLASFGHDSSDRAALYASDDHGTSWSRVGVGLPDGEWYYLKLWPVGAVIYAGGPSGLFRSTDDGETFMTLTPPDDLGGGGWLNVDGFLPRADGFLVAVQSDGIFHLGTDDRWQRAQAVDVTVRGLAYVPATGDLVTVTDCASVFRYHPGAGFTGIDGPDLWFSSFEGLNSVSVDPRNGAVITVGGYGSGLQRSVDGGTTWTNATNGSGSSLWWFGRSATNPDVLWVGSESGIYRSTDNGQLFEQVSTRGGGMVAIIDDATVVFESNRSLYRLTVGGTPTLVWDGNNRGGVWGVRRTDDGKLWAWGYDAGLIRSDDGAQTFQNVSLTHVNIRDLAGEPSSPSHLFIAADSGVLESRDAGVTFTDLAAPFPATRLVIDGSGHRLFVGTELGGVYVYAYAP